jgi:exopolysaccharide production protein ExoZ
MHAKIQSIQWLRAIAATGVAFHHATQYTGEVAVIGGAGVDVFFVISGYIMWTISTSGEPPARFMLKRIMRIVPLYWIATGILVLGAVAGRFPRVVLDSRDVVESLFFLPHVSPTHGQVWPLLAQGWTLNYEMFFYALLALTLFAPRAMQALLVTAVLAGLVAIGALLAPKGIAAQFYTGPLLLEFGAGLLLARFQHLLLKRGLMVAVVLTAAGTAGFTASYFLDLYEPNSRWLIWGIPSVLLVAGFISLEKAGVSFDWRPAVFLGDASYAIYLFHGFALSLLVKLLNFHAYPLLAILAGVAASLGLGAAVHVLMERRIQRALGFAIRRDWQWAHSLRVKGKGA